jgi:hypothetical protein
MIAASGTVIGILSTGCVFNQQTHYMLRLYNGSQESHTFRVRVGNDISGGNFHQETYEMDSKTASEEIPLDNIPSRIFLKIDSADEREFPWPASTDELGDIAQQADIWYDPSLAQDVLIYEG